MPIHRHQFEFECLAFVREFPDGFVACEHFLTLSVTNGTDGTDLPETNE
jgi:hypothetical protein